MNVTSKYRYYVPNQWQSRFDQYIEVSRMWGIHCYRFQARNKYMFFLAKRKVKQENKKSHSGPLDSKARNVTNVQRKKTCPNGANQ